MAMSKKWKVSIMSKSFFAAMKAVKTLAPQDNQPKTSGKKPSFLVYSVTTGKGKTNAFWSRIGAAFAHKDGEGFDITLAALPIDGRLVLRSPKAKLEGEEGAPRCWIERDEN